MKWDEWLKKIIKEITSDYTISEETSKCFFEELMQLLKYYRNRVEMQIFIRFFNLSWKSMI